MTEPSKTTAAALEQLHGMTDAAVTTPEATAEEKQHARGKKTARERVDALLDADSFVELDRLTRHRSQNFGLEKNRPYGDGVVTGYGTIDGRQVAVYTQDFTVFGGSLGEVHGQKIAKIQDFALRTGVPLIGILDGGGARIQEGVAALTQFAEIFRRNVAASGVIPQISIILGPSAGGAVYSPALTDFIVMADGTSQMFITGPDVIKAVTGEEVTFEELGGGHTHNVKSGVAHYLATDEDDAINYVQHLLQFLPQNNLSDPPAWGGEADLSLSDTDAALDTLDPDSDNQPYDMKTVIEAVLDEGDFFEIQPLFAPNVVIGFGHVEGSSVGIVANQPLSMAGTLDINAARRPRALCARATPSTSPC